MSHQVTWNVSDGWGVQCEARSVTPVLAEVAEGDHVGRAPRAGDIWPAGGRLISARHLHQSRGGNSDASRHMGTRSSSLRNGAGDPDRLSRRVRTAGTDHNNHHQSPPIYNPYPPGILPDDLVSEIERVRREVNVIFEEALGEWQALPPPTLTGQPPTLQGTGYQAVQILGKLLNFDETMSPFKNRGLRVPATCRTPPLADRSRPSI